MIALGGQLMLTHDAALQFMPRVAPCRASSCIVGVGIQRSMYGPGRYGGRGSIALVTTNDRKSTPLQR